jgi:predicted nucleic acid-binding protein
LTPYVVDASVVVKWFLPENGHEAARRLRRPGFECHAPDLLLLEVSNVFWRHVVQGKLELAIAGQALETLGLAPIRWRGPHTLFSEAFRLAAITRRSVYDCTYLGLAIQTDSLLVTADRRFYDAIRTGPFAPHLLWFEEIPIS